MSGDPFPQRDRISAAAGLAQQAEARHKAEAEFRSIQRDTRAIDALERIAAALERLAEQHGTPA